VFSSTLKLRLVRSSLVAMANIIKNDTTLLLKSCIDIIAYDLPSKKYRFSVVYHFLSHFYNMRLLVALQTNELLPVPTLLNYFKNIT